MSNKEAADTRRRIIESAATLFAKGGYNGASTREIAQGAHVNEVTMFRHFPRKRDLYLAVVDTELQNLRLRGDLLEAVAEAPDVRTALARTFDLLRTTLLEERDLPRLIQFSSLELGKDFEPLLRRHLRQLVEVLAGYLQPWIHKDQLHCSTRVVVLTFLAILLNYQSLFAVFSEELPGLAETLGTHADVYSVLAEVTN